MMPDSARESLRRTFGTVAELYDRARPGYPAALFDDLARLADLRPGSRVLEIGCGTGQATQSLAGHGYAITAVELSPDMAGLARQRLRDYPNVRVETGAFEQWPLPAQPFDLVLGAQAMHWIDPRVRYPKIAQALASGGWLAIFGHIHVGGGTRPFFEEVQDCYERFMPGTPPGLRLTEPDDLPHDDLGLPSSGLFEPPTFRRYLWQQAYSTAEYLDVLRTYSGHIDLEPTAQANLFDCIAGLIDSRYNGHITKAYLTELVLAHTRRAGMASAF
jgi:SAM-dependent methyltransferase